jgi:hypothetical protein
VRGHASAQRAAYELRSTSPPDARRETIRHLAELRAAVAGEVLATDKVEAIRATLQRIYSRFELHRAPLPDGWTVDDFYALEAGDYLITMDVREDAPVE